MQTQRFRFTLLLLVICLGAVALWLVAASGIFGGRAPVNVNTASFEELDAVPYLTPFAAKEIIAGRPFGSVDDLLRVNGIGEKTLAKIRRHVTTE